jgi:hypothetical protein
MLLSLCTHEIVPQSTAVCHRLFICRDCGELQGLQEEGYVIQPYETMLVNAGVQPLPILQMIVGKLLHAGKSMDVLLRLNRLSGLRTRAETQGMWHLCHFAIESFRAF